MILIFFKYLKYMKIYVEIKMKEFYCLVFVLKWDMVLINLKIFIKVVLFIINL